MRECGGTVANADAVGTGRVAGARRHRWHGGAAADAESLTAGGLWRCPLRNIVPLIDLSQPRCIPAASRLAQREEFRWMSSATR